MKLETVEKKLHMTYPKDFRDIYESGAMRWVCSKPQAKSHLFPNKLLEPEYYPYWNFLEFSVVEWSNHHLIEMADNGRKESRYFLSHGKMRETLIFSMLHWENRNPQFLC